MFIFYMFRGGTNFGFMNGANYSGKYEPTLTSYDYNTLLNEVGDMTPAYYTVRKINEKFLGTLPKLTAKNMVKKSYGKVVLAEKAFVLDIVDRYTNLYIQRHRNIWSILDKDMVLHCILQL